MKSSLLSTRTLQALVALLLFVGARETNARVPEKSPPSSSILTDDSDDHILRRVRRVEAGEVAHNNNSTSASPVTPKYPRHYHLLKPRKIKDLLYEWVNYYPDLVRLTNAQEQYGLPTAGDDDDCKYDDDISGCKNYILTIQDYIQHPEGSDSSNRLPEVFLSGELHGNERVGPTSVMEAAKLMLMAANCEAKPRSPDTHGFNEKGSDKQSQLKAAKDCRAQLKQGHGMDDKHRKWLARIVSTRRIVIVPTANALGYYRNRREEGRTDPNRDFPYDVTDATACMKTIAGRTINEIFLEHMFQLSLTFHGGMEVVGYEWGAPTWLGHLSPDDTAQQIIGGAYSQYGGGFRTSRPYNFGTMNDLVYFVRGGFEDWAYAGSWDPDRVIACQPNSFQGYDASKTVYNNSTLRVFNMLVETSNQKEPADNTLGSSLNVFDGDTTGNGHVSRNIRLSLLACDAVQPYVHMVGVNDVTLTTDVIPLAIQEGRSSCQGSQSVMVPGNQEDVQLRWTVGGAFDIDSTQLWYAKWDDVPEEVLNCRDMPSKADIDKYFKQATSTSAESGTGFFSKAGPTPKDDSTNDEALGPVFTATLDVSKGFKTHDKIVIVAGAQVDKSWTTQPADYAPKLPPQSHIVNARTNPGWHHESAGKIIQGRLDWYSLPLTVVVGDYKDNVGSQAGRPVGTVELSNRFGETTKFKGGMTPSTSAPGGGGEGVAEKTTESSEGRDASNSEASPAAGSSGGGTESASSDTRGVGPEGISTPQIVGIVLLLACLFCIFRRCTGYKKKPHPSYGAPYQDDDDDAEFGGYSDKPEVELS